MNQPCTSAVKHISWKGRSAWCLSNGVVEATVLEGGGHIAGFRFVQGSGPVNVLWEAPWKTIDPDQYHPAMHSRAYGPAPVGRFLSGFTGHALCLDLFGAPSEEETEQGLTLHGEAPVARWAAQVIDSGIRMRARLPVAGLLVERELSLRDRESVLYIAETVSNEREQERAVQWVQHTTLGRPLLAPGESVIAIPARRAKTWALGYGGKSLVPDDTEFSWPKLDGINISQPFARRGTGMVVAALLDQGRTYAFIAALNWRLGLVFGYCFRRQDFPWVAIWEENRAREDAPWNGNTQARGAEFGTTPMPIGKAAALEAGPLFDTPTFLTLPARGRKRVAYAAFIAEVPHDWRDLRDVTLSEHTISLHGPGNAHVGLQAVGLRGLLL